MGEIIVATTEEPESTAIVEVAEAHGVGVYQGSLNDVLDRFYQAAKPASPDYVVRITSDCPLLDPQLVDNVIKMAVDNDLDYCTNCFEEQYPDGQDVEVMKFSALQKAWNTAKLKSEREHVTPYIRNNSNVLGGSLFRAMNYPAPFDMGGIRMTVDEQPDLDAMRVLVDKLGIDQTWREYADFIVRHPEDFSNQDITRNEGYLKSIQKD